MFKSKYFNMGAVVFSDSVMVEMTENIQFAKNVVSALQRYSNKDWGEISVYDKRINDEALNYPEDLYISAFYMTCKEKILISTNRKSENAGDNCTTVLFPYER